MTDFDRSQLLIQQKQSNLLEMYEGKIQALLQEKLDNIIDDENYQNEKEDLRRIFLHQFNENLKEIDITTPEIHFKNVMTKALMGQVKRAFGCYHAVENIKPVINQYNMQLGDQVLDSPFTSTFALIEKVEKVQLALDILKAMEMPENIINHILGNIIDKEFPGKVTK